MTKQTVAVVLGAVVLFAVAVIGAMAFAGDSDSGRNIHTMPDGSIMTGPLDEDSMMGDGLEMEP